MEFIQIGYTMKTHGVAGEIKVFVEEPYEDLFLDSDRVFLDIKGSKQPFFLESVRGKGDLIVKFEDVRNREEALLLQSRPLLLPASEVPEMEMPAEDELEYARITGYQMTDVTLGPVGEVDEVLDLPQQEMAVVRYQGKEVLIPLNAQFVRSVDDVARTILVDLPEGLLSL